MCGCRFESYLAQFHSCCGDALVVRPLIPWLIDNLAGGSQILYSPSFFNFYSINILEIPMQYFSVHNTTVDKNNSEIFEFIIEN